MIALDYRSPGEPAVVHVDQELGYRITVLAPDFETFVAGLVNESNYDPDDGSERLTRAHSVLAAVTH
jgi:hypothetical protein